MKPVASSLAGLMGAAALILRRHERKWDSSPAQPVGKQFPVDNEAITSGLQHYCTLLLLPF